MSLCKLFLLYPVNGVHAVIKKKKREESEVRSQGKGQPLGKGLSTLCSVLHLKNEELLCK